MGEYKRKFGIYAAWNYELEVEELNKISEQGWQLIKGGCFSNKFKKNTEVQYRYQMDFQPGIEDKGRYIETFREQGWEYVSNTFNGWYYFRKLYDASRPEEEYEIFTDVSSAREMNNRWVLVGIVLALILTVCFAKKMISMIMFPNVLTLVQVVYLGVILAVFIRGILVMKNAEKPKNAKFDKVLIVLLFVWMLGVPFAGAKVMADRPVFNFTNSSAEYAPIPADLAEGEYAVSLVRSNASWELGKVYAFQKRQVESITVSDNAALNLYAPTLGLTEGVLTLNMFYNEDGTLKEITSNGSLGWVFNYNGKTVSVENNPYN